MIYTFAGQRLGTLLMLFLSVVSAASTAAFAADRVPEEPISFFSKISAQGGEWHEVANTSLGSEDAGEAKANDNKWHIHTLQHACPQGIKISFKASGEASENVSKDKSAPLRMSAFCTEGGRAMPFEVTSSADRKRVIFSVTSFLKFFISSSEPFGDLVYSGGSGSGSGSGSWFGLYSKESENLQIFSSKVRGQVSGESWKEMQRLGDQIGIDLCRSNSRLPIMEKVLAQICKTNSGLLKTKVLVEKEKQSTEPLHRQKEEFEALSLEVLRRSTTSDDLRSSALGWRGYRSKSFFDEVKKDLFWWSFSPQADKYFRQNALDFLCYYSKSSERIASIVEEIEELLLVNEEWNRELRRDIRSANFCIKRFVKEKNISDSTTNEFLKRQILAASKLSVRSTVFLADFIGSGDIKSLLMKEGARSLRDPLKILMKRDLNNTENSIATTAFFLYRSLFLDSEVEKVRYADLLSMFNTLSFNPEVRRLAFVGVAKIISETPTEKRIKLLYDIVIQGDVGSELSPIALNALLKIESKQPFSVPRYFELLVATLDSATGRLRQDALWGLGELGKSRKDRKVLPVLRAQTFYNEELGAHQHSRDFSRWDEVAVVSLAPDEYFAALIDLFLDGDTNKRIFRKVFNGILKELRPRILRGESVPMDFILGIQELMQSPRASLRMKRAAYQFLKEAETQGGALPLPSAVVFGSDPTVGLFETLSSLDLKKESDQLRLGSMFPALQEVFLDSSQPLEHREEALDGMKKIVRWSKVGVTYKEVLLENGNRVFFNPQTPVELKRNIYETLSFAFRKDNPREMLASQTEALKGMVANLDHDASERAAFFGTLAWNARIQGNSETTSFLRGVYEGGASLELPLNKDTQMLMEDEGLEEWGLMLDHRDAISIQGDNTLADIVGNLHNPNIPEKFWKLSLDFFCSETDKETFIEQFHWLLQITGDDNFIDETRKRLFACIQFNLSKFSRKEEL